MLDPNKLAAALTVMASFHPRCEVHFDFEHGINVLAGNEPSEAQEAVLLFWGWRFHRTLGCYFNDALHESKR